MRLQSPADPKEINWHKTGIPRIRDNILYDRIRKKRDYDVLSYLKDIYN